MSTELMELESAPGDSSGCEPEMARELTTVQTELLLGDDRPMIDYSKAVFSYNAVRLRRDRPDVEKAAIKMLAEPREVLPYRRIMKRLHMSYHLLRQVEISSFAKIAEEKKTLGDLAYTATEAFLDRAIAEAADPKSKMSGKDAMIGAGIGAEKFMLFRGEAGQRIEIGVKVDVTAKIDSAFNKIMAAVEGARQLAPGEDGVLRMEDSKDKTEEAILDSPSSILAGSEATP